jgi:hypothetical protein
MFHQNKSSNFQSLENNNQNIFDNRFQNIHNSGRNIVHENIPQNSRNNRKLEDNGVHGNFGNNGIGYGTYVNFQEDVQSRKDKNQVIYHNTSSYASQFESNFNSNFNNDIRKGMNSAPSTPLNPVQGHLSNYMFEHNMHYNYDANRNLGLGIPTNSNQSYDRNGDTNGMGQRRRTANVVQNNMQNSSYAFQNFETLNKIAEKEEEINRYMDRNPVNTRRDEIEKTRLADKKNFMNVQGGTMNNHHNFNDLKSQNTRKNENHSIQTNYIPNGRTMAIPRDLF